MGCHSAESSLQPRNRPRRRRRMYVVVINIADNQLWADYTGEEVEVKADSTGALAPEYLDVYVSSIKENDPFGFSVQILKSDSESNLETQADDRCGFP
jgi:hypothetical protein